MDNAGHANFSEYWKYGKIIDGALVRSFVQLSGFKPIRYEAIPADFDQQTQYIYQLAPVETSTEIYLGVQTATLQE